MGYYVLGVHRSGTSVVTRALALLVGDQLEPGAVESNPNGQWERWELRHHLDRLLLEHGSTWDRPPPIDVEWTSPPVGRLVRRGATRGFAGLGSRPWVWKDPRLCSTLPFWLSLAQAEPRFVVATRHPLDVAVSLVKRDGCPLDVALALWERSARALIGGLEGRAVFIVPHETLLGDPEATVASLASWVGTDVTGDPIEAAASVEARTGPVSQPDPGRLSPEQSVLWDCIDHPVGEARLVAKPPPESPSTAGLLGSASLTQRLATLARSHVRLRRHRG